MATFLPSRAELPNERSNIEVWCYFDTSSIVTLEEVKEHASFQKAEVPLSFGYDKPPTWIKVLAKNPSSNSFRGLLKIRSGFLYQIEAYIPGADSTAVYKAGNHYLSQDKNVKYRYPSFELELAPNSEKAIYIRVDNLGNNWFADVQLLEHNGFSKQVSIEQLTLGIFYGAILFILLPLTLLLLRTKSRMILSYIGFIIAMASLQIAKDGLYSEFIFKDYTDLNFKIFAFSMVSATICNSLFVKYYFHVNDFSKVFDSILKALVVFCLALLPLTFFLEGAVTVMRYFGLISIIGTLTVLSLCIVHFSRAKIKTAMYLLGYIPLILGTLYTVISAILGVRNVFLQEHSLKLGMIMEFSVLSVAIVMTFLWRNEKLQQKNILQLQALNATTLEKNKALELQLELEKEKAKSEMASLRAQMNPHFTFNVMNSIQSYINQNQASKASAYLGKFATLMRGILDGSAEQWVTIEKEIELLENYLTLEALRFKKPFSWEFTYSEYIEQDYHQIPSMIIQPFLENAIWHGFQTLKERDAHISIHFEGNDEILSCVITDNGIGRKAAEANKKGSQNHKSRGISIIKERLELLKQSDELEVGYTFEDLEENQEAIGTRILINFPNYD